MLRIWINRKEIPNGPFPITREQLKAARAEWNNVRREVNTFGGIAQCPSTVAREILSRVAPQLSDFDRLELAYVVTSKTVTMQEAEGGTR